jgi:D-amino peptidase
MMSHDALLMIGYHSRAGSDTNPLAPTISGKVSSIRINERTASEFLIHGFAAGLVKIPLAFISGDEGICDEAKSVISGITTLAVKRGFGDSTISIHPQLAVENIREGVRKALEGDLSSCLIELPDTSTSKSDTRTTPMPTMPPFSPEPHSRIPIYSPLKPISISKS